MEPEHSEHSEHDHDDDHQGHHARMAADFRRRFWVSLALSVPILALAPLLQGLVGLERALAFPGEAYVQFLLSAAVFFYGGWPFLKGLLEESRKKEPGMMTLIGTAIIVAFVYSSMVVFGLRGKVFFWELATLIDVMLLGHWIEMRSVMGASGYNVVAIPLAAGVLYPLGILLPPAVGALIMSISTVIVAVNARLLGRHGRRGKQNNQ